MKLWDNKGSNIRITGAQRERRKEVWLKKVFEGIMAENIPNFVKNTNLHIQQDKPTPNEIN